MICFISNVFLILETSYKPDYPNYYKNYHLWIHGFPLTSSECLWKLAKSYQQWGNSNMLYNHPHFFSVSSMNCKRRTYHPNKSTRKLSNSLPIHAACTIELFVKIRRSILHHIYFTLEIIKSHSTKHAAITDTPASTMFS